MAHGKCPYVLGPEYQHVLLQGPGPLFPQQQGSVQPHTLGNTDTRMVSASFPAAARTPAPRVLLSQCLLTSLSPPPPLPRVSVTLGVGVWATAAGGEKERERVWGCPPLLEDGCASLAAQAGGIKEDRDQSPSAPSLRGPRPQLQVHVLANHMFSLSPTTPSTQLANKQVRKP